MSTLKAQYDAKATRIIATTNDVDRDGEVVDPRGVKNFDQFMKTNPVILWQHRRNEAPVGKAVGGRVGEDRIELDVEWAPTPMGQEVKSLYDNGFMSSFSIGFIPRKSEDRKGQFTWSEWELLEVSAVSIPANPMANVIRSAESNGLNVSALKSYMGEDVESREAKESNPEAERQDTFLKDERRIKENTMSDEKTIDVEAIRKESAEQARKEIEREQEEKAERERVEAMEKELKQLKEKAAEDVRNKAVEPDVKVKGGSDDSRIVSAHRKFAEIQGRKGNPQAAKLAEQDSTKDLLKAFDDMQKAAMSNSSPIQKDMTNTDANGGYLNPIITHDLMAYARLNSVALRRANVVQMQTDYERIPTENAKVSLGYTDETAEAAETSATFSVAELTAKDLDGYADVAMHLEMDSQTPIAALLLDQFTEAYGQAIDSAVFAGEGDPVSGIFLGYGKSEEFDSGSTSFSEVLAGNVINAIGKINRADRRNAAWFAGRTALWTYLYNLEDSNRRKYFIPDMSGTAAGTFLGYPVEEIEDAPADAAGAAMAVFGDLEGMVVGTRLPNLTLFRDPYSLSAQHYVRYVFWTRVAFANALPNKFVGVVTAGS